MGKSRTATQYTGWTRLLQDCFKMLWTKFIVLLEPNMNYWINFVIKLDFGVTIISCVRPITCKKEWINCSWECWGLGEIDSMNWFPWEKDGLRLAIYNIKTVTK